MVQVKFGAIVAAIGVGLSFGSANFLSDYAVKKFQAPFWITLTIWYIVGALLSALISVFELWRNKQPILGKDRKVDGEALSAEDLRWSLFFCTTSALGSVTGMTTIKHCFIVGVSDLGPLSAIVDTNVIVIMLLCHFILKELMSVLQMIAIVVAFCGSLIISFGDKITGRRLSESTFWQALPWTLVAISGFVTSAFFYRMAFRTGLNVHGVNLVRMATTLGCALLFLAISMSIELEELKYSKAWMWFILVSTGVISGIGTVCCNIAMSYPCTAVALSIIGSGVTITLTVLTRIIYDDKPSTCKIVGMSIIAIAVSSMPLTARKQEIAITQKDSISIKIEDAPDIETAVPG